VRRPSQLPVRRNSPQKQSSLHPTVDLLSSGEIHNKSYEDHKCAIGSLRTDYQNSKRDRVAVAAVIDAHCTHVFAAIVAIAAKRHRTSPRNRCILARVASGRQPLFTTLENFTTSHCRWN